MYVYIIGALPLILGMKKCFCVSSWLSWEICTEIKTHYSQPIFPLSNIHINVVCRKRFPRHSTVTIFATAVHLFFLYSPIVHSYVTDWIFNFSLILCTIQAKHARAICWKITAGGDLSFLFSKSINMLWKILSDSKLLTLYIELCMMRCVKNGASCFSCISKTKRGYGNYILNRLIYL